MAPKTRQAQLQTDLNKMAAEQHLEYLRSTQFTEATVQVAASFINPSRVISLANLGIVRLLSTSSCMSTCSQFA